MSKYAQYRRAEYVNALAGPSPIAITRGTDGRFYCENRHGKAVAGPYATERLATKRAYHLVERGRHPDAKLTPREINERFERNWRGR